MKLKTIITRGVISTKSNHSVISTGATPSVISTKAGGRMEKSISNRSFDSLRSLKMTGSVISTKRSAWRNLFATALMLVVLVSCSKWNMTESVDIDSTHPWDRDPYLWEEYKAELRAYKQRRHNLVYVRFDNASENPGSEKNFMRCLPDSLDYVSLTNAENFSAYDAEDMEWMHSVGTKVLFQFDLSQGIDIEKSVLTAEEYGLDGFALSGITRANTGRVAEILSRLSGKGVIAYEGNPALIQDEDIDKIALFVLSSETVENSYDLNNLIQDAVDHGVPRDRILLAASMSGSWYDSSNAEQPVVPSMADNVITFGPLAGLALYDIMSDYFHYEGNWLTIRQTISRLNP